MPPTCTSVTILPGRRGDGAINAPCTEDVHYLVKFSDTTALAQDAMRATDGTTAIPKGLTSLSAAWPWLYLQKITPTQRTTDPCFWDVICSYTAIVPQQQTPKPPTAQKYNVDISGTLIPREFEIDHDVSNKTIQSSGRDPITGITRTIYDEQINVSFHVYKPDWATIDTCKGCSNDAPVTLVINGAARVFPIHTLKLENVSWGLEADCEGTKTVRLDLVLIYRKETWTHKPADMGFHKLVGSVISEITIGDVNAANGGNATNATVKATPTYLNGSGGILANGSNITTLSFESVVKTSFSTLLSEITT